MTTTNRHLSRSAIEEYLVTAAPATVVVPGEPTCRVVIDPSMQRMALRTPLQGSPPELGEFEHIRARSVSADGRPWSELMVDYGDHAHETYLLLSDVADMIQQNGLSFDVAVRSTLTMFEDLLSRTSGLSPEQQTGLYGELLFLGSCLRQMPHDAAVASWRGALAHEHDFVFPGLCIEIKATQQERRRHRIGRLEQLEPTPGSALWLMSVQLTQGYDDTRTLPELIDDVRIAAAGAQSALDAKLAQVGWRERDRPRYRERSTLRTRPAAYLVADDVPVLSRRHIEQVSPRPELIVDAAYTIDLTSLPASRPPAPADRFVEGDD